MAEPPLRVTLSAMSALEYDSIIYQWPLSKLYVWMLSRHAEAFDKMVQQAVQDHKTLMGN